jgi:ribosomal protein L31E
MDKFNDKMTHEEIQTLIKKLVNEKLISDKNEDIPIRRRIEYLVEKEEEEEKDEIDDEDVDYDDDDDDTIYEEDE